MLYRQTRIEDRCFKVVVCSHEERPIPEPLTLTVSLRGTREVKEGYQLFRLTGLLDAFSEPAFRKVFNKCLEEGPIHLILDLSQIDFVDSSGLGALVQLFKKAQSLNGSLQIVANPRVTQTMKLVRLDKYLTLQPSIEAAIAGVSQS
ncbi:STAS domain-containing protein [Trichothermofontia sichuanensis]|uniref:STAS domain-containing protein n=1 Tax=Trichothermofontia sichuanensis TaxID=3045816 RepID=UPI0036F2F343